MDEKLIPDAIKEPLVAWKQTNVHQSFDGAKMIAYVNSLGMGKQDTVEAKTDYNIYYENSAIKEVVGEILKVELTSENILNVRCLIYKDKADTFGIDLNNIPEPISLPLNVCV